MNDLTIIYLTANEIPEKFAVSLRKQLVMASSGAAVLSVTKKPLFFGNPNIHLDTPRSHISIYRQALEGARAAKTKYVAIAEDDVLYSPNHFKKRPTKPGVFAYNVACWGIFTWSKPALYSYSGRRNLGQLICERSAFIEAMEERFALYSDESKIPIAVWGEPGKYESQLGVKVRETEGFYTDPANIAFSHPSALGFLGLGERKRLAPIRAYDIPFWGRAEEIVKLYE